MIPEELQAIRERIAAATGPLCGTEGQPMQWPGKSGGCLSCDARIAETLDFPESFSRPFIVCATCGNKRCPKAAWHGNQCSGSNNPGQSARHPKSDLMEHAADDLAALLAEVGRLRGLASPPMQTVGHAVVLRFENSRGEFLEFADCTPTIYESEEDAADELDDFKHSTLDQSEAFICRLVRDGS